MTRTTHPYRHTLLVGGQRAVDTHNTELLPHGQVMLLLLPYLSSRNCFGKGNEPKVFGVLETERERERLTKWPRCCNVQCVSVVRKERCCVSNGPDSRQTNSRMATFQTKRRGAEYMPYHSRTNQQGLDLCKQPQRHLAVEKANTVTPCDYYQPFLFGCWGDLGKGIYYTLCINTTHIVSFPSRSRTGRFKKKTRQPFQIAEGKIDILWSVKKKKRRMQIPEC